MLMPRFRQPEHNVSALADLRAFFAQRGRHRWLFLALSFLIPGLIIAGLVHDSTMRKEYHPPEVVFIEAWKPGRTDAEIKAQQAIDAPRERAERAAEHAAIEKRKAEFRKVADQMGIDVDSK